MLSGLRLLVSNRQRLVWSELLQWINLIFIIFIVVQIAMAAGVWVVSSQVKPFLQGHNPDVLPSLLVLSSLMTICMATLGYNGALHSASPNADERFLSLQRLMWFEILGTILGILSLALGTTGFTVVHGDILWAADRGLKSDMAHYSSTPQAKDKIDRLQTAYKCCGASSYRDWFSIAWQKYSTRKKGELEDSAPWSCCSPESPRPCIHFSVTQNIEHKAYSYPGDLTLHSQGCVAAITKYLGHHMFYICGALMLFIGFTLIGIVLWTRLLETSIANAYRLGDPEGYAWGYFIVNYGPDVDDIYEEIDQSADSYDDERGNTYSTEHSSKYQPDSDLGENDSSEEVLAVSSVIPLPSPLTISQDANNQSGTPNSSLPSSASPNDNNNRSPNNNDTLLRYIKETQRKQQAKADKKNKQKTLKIRRVHSVPTPSPSPPLIPAPPPLPPPPQVQNDENNIPPLPPLPFQ
ncbi:photoreceptor outer segment membrane glycoprotein 2-like [Watersipora subatra]|uniref:photoreceptor outer segment membrane glycoprotein 2-like n=1 Tax=Watersipora subatra TaxID=2589382 RepID=UPI00355C2A58